MDEGIKTQVYSYVYRSKTHVEDWYRLRNKKQEYSHVCSSKIHVGDWCGLGNKKTGIFTCI